jgi:hypothetical protein
MANSTNNRIKVSELDYNQIRENLKTFMRGQSQFSDYDFEGSALSTLIDLLAYNTHYNALYTNLAINEMFLDSASKRSSVVSIANNFGYTPQSCTTARSSLNVTLTQQGATAQIKYIPKLSSFSTTINSVQYSFYTLQDYSATLNANTYSFKNVEVYEGFAQTQLFLCSSLEQKFVLPNKDIDVATISLTVQQTGEQPDYEKYSLAKDVLDLTTDSKIYFIKELDDQTYQISFGVNGLGKSISIGNIITITYMISNKTLGNGATVFTYTGTGLGGVVSCSTVSTSYGGKESETVDQIKSNVSQSFFDQNRAVTAGDYTSLIKRLYTNLDSINVWGGEDNDPPQYGKVYISIKPTNGPYLTPPEKAYLTQTLLKSKNVVSVTPEIVDPSYLNMEVDTTIYYNDKKTTRSADELAVAIQNTIASYRDTNLKKFDGIFRMSKFATAIDATDQSILSSITTFTVYSEVLPKYNAPATYTLNIVNPIYNEKVPEEALKTTGFYIDNSDTIYYLDDDGVGNIRLYSLITSTGEKIIKNSSIGTINYINGSIVVRGLRITNLVEANFYFIIKTQSYDVVSVRNQIVDIPPERVTIHIIQDTTASTGLISGNNYTFTSSRN